VGIYSDYLNSGLNGDALNNERKKQLQRIADIRKRELLVYAADQNPVKGQQGVPIALDFDDLLPINDQLDNLIGDAIDIIIESPGGNGATAEEIVRIVRNKFQSVAMIIPGHAKSAATILAMAGNEILMDDRSAVGPIDAQIRFEGKQFSAEALLKGIEKIKEECQQTGSLNRAYIPMLQRISPGDIQHTQNALDFARLLVRDWLFEHKFANWTVHRTHNSGTPVTEEEKRQRAEEIAAALCDHSRWLHHGRSIRMVDLRNLGLEINDFSKDVELSDAIRRYYVLLRMTFDMSPCYKVIETPTSQLLRMNIQALMPSFLPQFPGGPITPVPQGGRAPIPVPSPGAPFQAAQATGMIMIVVCPNCGSRYEVQADFDTAKQLQANKIRYPADDVIRCQQCGNQINLAQARIQMEMTSKRRIARG
jgi:Serine dehydrogenase proteinase